MGKRLIILLAAVFVVGLAATTYAATQNVKVSGDLLLRAITRDDFTLGDDEGMEYHVAGVTATTRLRVDADLTDNVAVVVRLINERSWGEELVSTLFQGYTGYYDDDGGGNDVSHRHSYDYYDNYTTTNIDVDLAYVTLKEFLYSPLTLTLGRQELRFGNALIIGDPDTNQLSANPWVPMDLSARKSFDAIRGTLNYDNLVIDLIYSKIRENGLWWFTSFSNDSLPESNDVDLYGINAKYDLKEIGITGTLDGYYFAKIDSFAADNADSYIGTGKKDTVFNVGALISGKITDNLNGSLELAYQFGNKAYDIYSDLYDLSRSALAIQAGLNYVLPFEKTKKYSPVVGIVYTRLSGDNDYGDGKYNAWDPMFEDQIPNAIPNALFANSNCQVWNLKASFKPIEDVTVNAVYGYYRLVDDMYDNDLISPYGEDEWNSSVGNYYTMTDGKFLGHALDVTAIYDYTEDVQFALTFGMFDPSLSSFDKYYDINDTATQVIGSMKVTF